MEAVATAEMCEQEIDQLAAYTAIVREYSSAHGALQEYSKRVSTLDEKGNVLEDTDIDVKDGSIKGKRSFAYEFDAKGKLDKEDEFEVGHEGRSVLLRASHRVSPNSYLFHGLNPTRRRKS